MGRPVKFEKLEDLETAIDAFFDKCDEKEEPYTIFGLCNAIGICRDTLMRYGNKDAFSDAIKRARQRCAEYTEKYLYTGKNASSAMFSLKCNYGWKEPTEESKGTIINIIDSTKEVLNDED